MKTIRITEISQTAFSKKYDFWNEHLAPLGLKLEVVFMELPDIAKLKVQTLEAMKNSEIIRYDKKLWSHVPSLASHEPASINYAQSADGLVKEEGRFWLPRDMVSSALKELAVQKIKTLSYKGVAIVVGCNAQSKIAAQVVATWGFKRINFIPEAEEDMTPWLTELQAHFFGLEMSILDPQTVTLQPANASLLVNTLVHDEFPEILTDIYYFNFLRKEGAVVDMVVSATQTQLITETKRTGLRFIEGHEISFCEDLNWFLHLMPDLSLETLLVPEMFEKYRTVLS